MAFTMFESEQEIIEREIKGMSRQLGWGEFQPKWSWIPFNGQWGIATSFFELAARVVSHDSPLPINDLAAQMADKVKQNLKIIPGIDSIQATKGYLNIYFDSTFYARHVIDAVINIGEEYGRGKDSARTIMVEFSQPNSLKAFHVGHLRNMVLGAAISSILEYSGNKVVRANYLGDIGLHVITWLWNYGKYHKGEEPPAQNQIRWMGDLYAEAVRRREESADNEAEIRALFKKWNEKDEELIGIWERTRQWSLQAFDQIYQQMGISFDHIYYESEVEDAGKILIEDLIRRGLAKDERPAGSVYIDLDELQGTTDKYRVLVLLRSDGTSLYSTKDIPLAIKKFEQYRLDQSIYVVDVRQSLYFKQIFKVLELMGFPWSKNCYHLAYEIVNLPGNVTIASREGAVILLEDLIREAEQRALAIVEKKNPDLSQQEKEDVALAVAIGAIKYSLLSRDNTKVITFDWDSALDVNGQAAPYILYAGVRANSILKKSGNLIPDSADINQDLTQQEIQLVELISRFPQEVQRAAQGLRPLILTNYSFELARAFNDFYAVCPVLNEREEIRNFRIRLVKAARQTIINVLRLLGITLPNVM
jgi:arginyl-tRNA synthetase